MAVVDAEALVEAAGAVLSDGRAIRNHINSLPAGSTRGIELAFANPLTTLLKEQGFDVRPERPLAEIGARQFSAGRKRGSVDAVFYEGGTPSSAAEYKAIRMPRNKGGARFDLGQLAADYLRLAAATKIEQGFLVAFLYGPDVEILDDGGTLWQRFHNQLHRDVRTAIEREQLSPDNWDAAYQLNWTEFEPTTNIPLFGRAVKCRDLGAVIIECKN